MRKSLFGKKSVNTSLFLALLFTLSLCIFVHASSTVASAASPATFDGVWNGATTSGSTVALTLQPKTSSLRYGSPRNCAVTLGAPVDIDAKSRNYGISMANGGFCTKMESGKVLLQLGSDGNSLTFEAQSVDGKSLDKGMLRRSGK